MLILLAAALSPTGFGPAELAEAAIRKATSFIELIQQRSPGHRTRGQLLTKHHAAARPHQRALAKVIIPAILPPGPPSLFQFVAPPLTPELASLEALPIASLAELTPAPLVPPGFSSPPGLILPPTETPSPPPPVVIPPVTPSAVPEPGTWASMLLGFALLGWRLRRRNPLLIDAA